MSAHILYSCEIEALASGTSLGDDDLHLVVSGGHILANQQVSEEVEQAVVKRLHKTRTPSVISLTLPADKQVERSSVTFYMHVLTSCDLKVATSVPEHHDTLIICYLLVGHDLPLDLFTTDLSSHAQQLKLSCHVSEDARSQLESWYDEAVRYLCRVVCAHNEEDLAMLIHLALTATPYDVSNVSGEEDKKLLSDLDKFLSCSSISQMLNMETSSGLSSNLASLAGQTLTLSVQDGRLIVPSEWRVKTASNHYCLKWAQYLKEQVTRSRSLSSEAGAANYESAENERKYTDALTEDFSLKQVVDSLKLKTIQSLNRFKRLVKQAEYDHYALYRGYLFLKQSGTRDILLPLMRYELESGSKDSSQQNTADILCVLEEFAHDH